MVFLDFALNCVPDVDNLIIIEIMEEVHLSTYNVHLGAPRMYHNLKNIYWWHDIKRDLVKFFSKCLTCQHVKFELSLLSYFNNFRYPNGSEREDNHKFHCWTASG